MISQQESEESSWVEIRLDIVPKSLVGTDMQAVQSFAGKIVAIGRTQVWIFGTNLVKIGKVPSGLFIREVTNDVVEKDGWLTIRKPAISKDLFEGCAISIVCPSEKVSCISDLVGDFSNWLQMERGERVIVHTPQSIPLTTRKER